MPLDPDKLILVAAVVGFTLVAAVCDYRTKRLPNWLTVPAFAAGVGYQVVGGVVREGALGAWHGLLFALAGFAVGFGILLVLWLIGGGGAGDVKLMGAVGAWLGAWYTLEVFFVSTVFVAMGSVAVLAWHMMSQGVGRTKRRFLSTSSGPPQKGAASADEARLQRKTRRRLMPYGVPVALATWVVLAWSLLHVAS